MKIRSSEAFLFLKLVHMHKDMSEDAGISKMLSFLYLLFSFLLLGFLLLPNMI